MDLKDLAFGALKEAFKPCGLQGCEKRSIGFECSRCAEKVCQRHHYLSPPDPSDPMPRVVCSACIAEEWENHQAFAAQQSQKRGKR